MKNWWILFFLPLLLIGCSDDADFIEPSFLHIEGMKVVQNSENNLSSDSGFYRSEIVAAYIVAHFEGKNSEDTIGLFELPCTLPILYSGTLDYLEVYPAVKMSGISATLPYYIFYDKHRIENLVVRSNDTTELGVLDVTYGISREDILLYEAFEPTEASILFDSVLDWERSSVEQACSGYGYGKVHVDSSNSTKTFSIDYDFIVGDASSVLYLELDSRSDVLLEVYMTSKYVSGGNSDRLPVMRIYPSQQWQHMYINLGRTWREFNYFYEFQLSFTALNLDNVEGDVRIDNVKVIKK